MHSLRGHREAADSHLTSVLVVGLAKESSACSFIPAQEGKAREI